MKKIIWYCLPMIVLGIMMIGTVFVPQSLSFEFETIKGDVSTLKQVEFNAEIINNLDFSSNDVTSILINNKEGEISHTFDYHKDLYVDRELGESPYPNFNPSPFISASVDDEECNIEKTPIENEIPVIYTFDDLVDESGNQLKIDTDMVYQNTDQYQLYEYNISCNGEFIEKQYSKENKKTKQDEEVEDIYNKIEKATDNLYYFLPVTTSYMTGTNKIYKLNTIENNTNSTFQYQEVQAKVSTFAQLPEGRYYDKLIIIKDRIYIACHTESESYLMQFDEEGNFINEKAYGLKVVVYSMKNNDDFILYRTENEILVIDQHSLEIIETYELPENDEASLNYIVDMIYKNKTLYLLEEIEVHARKDNVDIYSTIGYEIQAIKNGKVCYQGILDIYDSREINSSNLFEVYIHDAGFKRDDV